MKIKTAVIGVGNMGKHHARILESISQFQAVADINLEEAKHIAQKYKVRFYQDYREMLSKEKLEAVSIAVPTKFHKEIGVNCLRQKIATLMEKPIVEKLADAQEIVKEAKENRTFLMVGHVERFNPVVIKLKQLISQGKFGGVISLLVIRVGLAPPKVENADVVLDLGIHDVDVFNYLLGEYPGEKNIIRKKIFTQNIADSALILLKYSEAIGIIQTNWITPIKMRKLYLTGTDGFAEADYVSQKLIVYDKIVSKIQNGNFFELLSISEAPKKEIYVSKKEPLRQELLFFLDCVAKKATIEVEHALEALKIVQAI